MSSLSENFRSLSQCLELALQDRDNEGVTRHQITTMSRILLKFGRYEMTKDDKKKYLLYIMQCIEVCARYSQHEISYKICAIVLHHIFDGIQSTLDKFKMKNVLVGKLSEQIIKLISEECVGSVWFVKELLKTYNACLRTVAVQAREQMALSRKYDYLKLFDTVSNTGDYETQMLIMQTITSTFTDKVLDKSSQDFIPESEELCEALRTIQMDAFDGDVRYFLNIFNRKVENTIYSIQCETIAFADDIVFMEGKDQPEQASVMSPMMWIDVNLIEMLVSFFFHSDYLPANNKFDEQINAHRAFEVVYFEAKNVFNHKISVLNDTTIVLLVHFKEACFCLFDNLQKVLNSVDGMEFSFSSSTSNINRLVEIFEKYSSSASDVSSANALCSTTTTSTIKLSSALQHTNVDKVSCDIQDLLTDEVDNKLPKVSLQEKLTYSVPSLSTYSFNEVVCGTKNNISLHSSSSKSTALNSTSNINNVSMPSYLLLPPPRTTNGTRDVIRPKISVADKSEQIKECNPDLPISNNNDMPVNETTKIIVFDKNHPKMSYYDNHDDNNIEDNTSFQDISKTSTAENALLLSNNENDDENRVQLDVDDDTPDLDIADQLNGSPIAANTSGVVPGHFFVNVIVTAGDGKNDDTHQEQQQQQISSSSSSDKSIIDLNVNEESSNSGHDFNNDEIIVRRNNVDDRSDLKGSDNVDNINTVQLDTSDICFFNTVAAGKNKKISNSNDYDDANGEELHKSRSNKGSKNLKKSKSDDLIKIMEKNNNHKSSVDDDVQRQKNCFVKLIKMTLTDCGDEKRKQQQHKPNSFESNDETMSIVSDHDVNDHNDILLESKNLSPADDIDMIRDAVETEDIVMAREFESVEETEMARKLESDEKTEMNLLDLSSLMDVIQATENDITIVDCDHSLTDNSSFVNLTIPAELLNTSTSSSRNNDKSETAKNAIRIKDSKMSTKVRLIEETSRCKNVQQEQTVNDVSSIKSKSTTTSRRRKLYDANDDADDYTMMQIDEDKEMLSSVPASHNQQLGDDYTTHKSDDNINNNCSFSSTTASSSCTVYDGFVKNLQPSQWTNSSNNKFDNIINQNESNVGKMNVEKNRTKKIDYHHHRCRRHYSKLKKQILKQTDIDVTPTTAVAVDKIRVRLGRLAVYLTQNGFERIYVEFKEYLESHKKTMRQCYVVDDDNNQMSSSPPSSVGSLSILLSGDDVKNIDDNDGCKFKSKLLKRGNNLDDFNNDDLPEKRSNKNKEQKKIHVVSNILLNPKHQ